MNTRIDISVIVTAHHEGQLANYTMLSLYRAFEYAQARGLSPEIIVVMDKPDQQTIDYFSLPQHTRLKVCPVDFGDLGLSRNYGVTLASGRYVAFLDADNLIAGDWLTKVVNYLDHVDQDIVVHPEYHVVFEGKNLIWQQISSDHPHFHLENLLENNYWDAVCASRTSVFKKHPYESTTRSPGFGFEDWHFNCQTLAHGIPHQVIPESVHFLRIKTSGSLLAYTLHANRTIRPTKLFEPEVLSRLLEADRLATNLVNSAPTAFPPVQREQLRKKIGLAFPLGARVFSSTRRRARAMKELATQILSRVLGRDARTAPPPQPSPASSAIASIKNLPPWLLAEWRQIHRLEPKTLNQEHLIDPIAIYRGPNSRIGQHYLELSKRYGAKGISHLFLIPRVDQHHATTLLHYANALLQGKMTRGITIIATDSAKNSSPPVQLPLGVNCVDFGDYCHRLGLTPEEQEKILLRLLLQMAPPVIHAIDDEFGFQLIHKFGKALSEQSHLFVSLANQEVPALREGTSAEDRWPAGCESIHALFCEEPALSARLQARYNLPQEKIVFPHPPSSVVEGLPAFINQLRQVEGYLTDEFTQ